MFGTEMGHCGCLCVCVCDLKTQNICSRDRGGNMDILRFYVVLFVWVFSSSDSVSYTNASKTGWFWMQRLTVVLKLGRPFTKTVNTLNVSYFVLHDNVFVLRFLLIQFSKSVLHGLGFLFFFVFRDGVGLLA